MDEEKAVALSVVVPIFNEQDNIVPFLERMLPILNRISSNYEIIFCYDPSTDQTEQVVRQQMDNNKKIKLLKLSRRFGQAAATMAGLSYSVGAAVVVIDVDLQDPPELIEEMYQRYLSGVDVIYAQRLSRKGESWLKKIVANLGYRAIAKLADCSIPRNTGDYRMMSRRVVEGIVELQDQQGFLRGLVAYVGFKQEAITYHRDGRNAGDGKYNRYVGSLKIGLNGLVGFGRNILALLYVPALMLVLLSMGWGSYHLILFLLGGGIPSGMAMLACGMCLLSGVQLLAMALLGEYIGRLYMERTSRPLFIVDSFHQNS